LYLDELREQGAPAPLPTTDEDYVTVQQSLRFTNCAPNQLKLTAAIVLVLKFLETAQIVG
jgi:hypothetical protein